MSESLSSEKSKLVLFKEPSEKFEKAFKKEGFSNCIFVPVFTFEFSLSNHLISIIHSCLSLSLSSSSLSSSSGSSSVSNTNINTTIEFPYSGIVLTSPRASEALIKILSMYNNNNNNNNNNNTNEYNILHSNSSSKSTSQINTTVHKDDEKKDQNQKQDQDQDHHHHHHHTQINLPFPIFSIGEATKQILIEKYPSLNIITFEESVDASSLAQQMIKYLNQEKKNNSSTIKPLLLLLGERHRLELTTELSTQKIGYEIEIVYKSVDNEDLGNFTDDDDDDNINDNIIDSPNNNNNNNNNNEKKMKKKSNRKKYSIIWCFFSPNGVTVVDKYLLTKLSQNLEEYVKHHHIILCAFGNTTARKLNDFKCNTDIISSKPTPDSLASCIKKFINPTLTTT